MLKLLPSERSHLERFVLMEGCSDNTQFIISNPLSVHQQLFNEPHIHYLTIQSDGKVVGFIILAVEVESHSVEFRRIVIAEKGLGIGQKAIMLMEEYVLEELCTKRIWLDVFEDNLRALYIYQKLGYQQFNTKPHDDKTLLLLEKYLN